MLKIFPPAIGEYHSKLCQDSSNGASPNYYNSRHQLQLINMANQLAGDLSQQQISVPSILAGDLISDFGKTADGKALLTKPTDKSNEFIETLQTKVKSNCKASQAIRATLSSKFIQDQCSLINPNLKPDEVRKQFNDHPILQGALHELPGLSLLIKDFNDKNVSFEDFEKIFWVNFGHNGPAKGFWEFLFGVINKQIKDGVDITIHHGTPFEGETVNGKKLITYPMPQTFEGFMHTSVDREDQAIGGIAKLATEISEKGPLSFNDIATNLLGGNQERTLEQINALEEHLPQLKLETSSNPFIDEISGLCQNILNGVRQRIRKFHEYIKENATISFNQESNEANKITFQHPDGMNETLSHIPDKGYKHVVVKRQYEDSREGNKEFVDNVVTGFYDRVVKGFNNTYNQSA